MDIESSINFPPELYLSSSDYSSYKKEIERLVKVFLDKDGYEHSLYVANSLSDSLVLWTIGILHDFIEDTKDHELHHCMMYQLDAILGSYLEDEDVFSIFESLDLLTREEDQTYYQYIQRICHSKNILAITVKSRDLKHNISRCNKSISNGPSDPFYDKSKSLLPRYEKSYLEIASAFTKWFTGLDI